MHRQQNINSIYVLQGNLQKMSAFIMTLLLHNYNMLAALQLMLLVAALSQQRPKFNPR